ncbi:MAG TPA: metalloregulator ArsR/SmtB family transcription factor [Anaerolineales bacterium]|nr:metalloregulator ArsR/SmtB family transcription factor [Anaerolineales bacterium]
MKTLSKVQKISAVLEEIAHPVRLAILLSIGNEEACVCHLEALLGKRQAYISQHLMALRDGGILLTRREGKFIFYRLRDPMLLNLIELAAKMENVDISDVPTSATCNCPNCSPKNEEKFAYSPG